MATGASMEFRSGVGNAAPEALATSGLAGIVGQLRGLQPFPEAAQRLLLLIWDPDHDSERVVEIVQSDPTLTARVLRLINSGAFGLRRACESVRRAVVLLGSIQVGQIAVAQLALDQFHETGPQGRRIVEHCQRTAKLCRALASRRSRLRNVDVFTPGMLHDLGKLLLLQVDQGEYAAMLAETPEEPDVLHALERVRFGYDHAILANHVMATWRLPESLLQLIAMHHDLPPEGASPTLIESLHVLRLADRLSYALVGDPLGESEKLEALAATEEAQALELDAYRLAQLWPTYFELVG